MSEDKDVPSVQYDPSSQPSKNRSVFVYTMSRNARKDRRRKKEPGRHKRGALVDRGANGGVAGAGMRVMHEHQETVDVSGIDNHTINSLKIVGGTAKILAQHGPVIGIFNRYAHAASGPSIHSAGHIEAYKNQVFDRPLKVGGRQCIKTVGGYVIPIDYVNGLPRIKMCPNTGEEWKTLPHVVMTPPQEWDPKDIDLMLSERADWCNMVKQDKDGEFQTRSNFTRTGDYKKRYLFDTISSPTVPETPVEFEDDEEPEFVHVNTHKTRTVNFHETQILFHEASDLNKRFVLYYGHKIEKGGNR